MYAKTPACRAAHIAVVIPCYNVAPQIADVLHGLPPLVRTIVCVDDASPDHVGDRIEELGLPRVVLLRHQRNQGVGGAMLTGYRESLRLGADVIVKMDGDGQMDAAQLPLLLQPLLQGKSDYVKGNRWHHPAALAAMPAARWLGSIGLSLLTKAASGYWQIFDSCNGYTAIRGSVLAQVPFERLARDYFFETSLLVELNILRAAVCDVPLPARYGEEQSSMRLGRVLRRFPVGLASAFLRRVWHRHFVRAFGPAALCLSSGTLLTGWGVGFGAWHWLDSVLSGTPATAGTVMLASLPLLMGFQLLLQFASTDIFDQPQQALGCDEGLVLETPSELPRSRAA